MGLVTNLLTQTRTDIKTDLSLSILAGAIGTGNTPFDVSDTALDAEVFEDTLDSFDIITFPDKFIGSIIIGLSEANGNTIQEVGTKDAVSGNLQSRNVVNSITKTSDVRLFLDLQIEIEVVEV